MSERRGLMSVSASGSDVLIESGQFTVSEKTKTYDIAHSLGTVPNFVFIYPVDVSDASTTYLQMAQVLVNNCGQDQWRAGTDTADRSGAHSIDARVGYSTSVHAASPYDALPKTVTINTKVTTYAGLLTDSFVRVGGIDQTSGGGWLLGTYGYIIGVMPFITPNS